VKELPLRRGEPEILVPVRPLPSEMYYREMAGWPEPTIETDKYRLRTGMAQMAISVVQLEAAGALKYAPLDVLIDEFHLVTFRALRYWLVEGEDDGCGCFPQQR